MMEEFDSVSVSYLSYDLMARTDHILLVVYGICDEYAINCPFMSSAAVNNYGRTKENHAYMLNCSQTGLQVFM